MNVKEMAAELGLVVKAGEGGLEKDVLGGYVGDLLSDVLANSQEGDVWVTLQSHQNTIAVASMKDLAAIILINNREPEEETVTKADQEEIPLLGTGLSAFELVGRLHELGVTGSRE